VPDDPAKPAISPAPAPPPRRVCVVTGSRAEFGLLVPVIRAIEDHPRLERVVVVCGSHLLAPAYTAREVEALFSVAARVPMQDPGASAGITRLADAAAMGRGAEGLAKAFSSILPDWVVVLGDRVEAFAAAAAASIGGIALAHIHGGDRAEGIADEAMRHAITKLAHLHLPATPTSAGRIERMGEPPERIRLVGSPAVDGLEDIPPLDEADAQALGDPSCVLLIHPSGLPPERERALVGAVTRAVDVATAGKVLCLAPNHDPGRDIVVEALFDRSMRPEGRSTWTAVEHVPRPTFVALLKRLARNPRGVLVGNSSSGLIEAAAVGLPAVNVGPRQAGRERPDNVTDVPEERLGDLAGVIEAARTADRSRWGGQPYGDGHAGERIAAALAEVDPREPSLLRKHNSY
jgi:UDP-hydrolysing UDP-N-acetyl-D-glucosamine 2-epimerase